jgi:hypothetical protein
MTISEVDIAISVKNKVVRNFIITQTTSGRYQITIELTWRKELLKAITARKTIKEWASLDRLVAHIHEAYGTAPPITLKLCETEELNR